MLSDIEMSRQLKTIKRLKNKFLFKLSKLLRLKLSFFHLHLIFWDQSGHIFVVSSVILVAFHVLSFDETFDPLLDSLGIWLELGR